MEYDYPFSGFLVISGISLGLVVALMVLTAVLTKVTGKVSVVDTIWGLGFIAVTLVATYLGFWQRDSLSCLLPLTYGPDGQAVATCSDFVADVSHDQKVRALVLVLLVSVWGGRLALHIFRRGRGAGEDPRYEELMARGPGGLVRKVLLPQGLAIWFVSLPIQVAAVAGPVVDPVLWAGVALFAVGLVFESVGDAQLAAYKKDPDRGPVMDRGLWRYTRHPNYFGDACVWWGIYLVCASSWPGVFTILSPIAMTYFLVFATGARLLERTMMQRPGYPEYAAKTSMFFPLPPKR
jgi:steroid 5-alpha reductase family enzyme